MLRTGIETIICLSPNFLYVYVYVFSPTERTAGSQLAVYLQIAAKVCVKRSRFTGSSVRGSQFANYQRPEYLDNHFSQILPRLSEIIDLF